ncbi:carbohydrate ABC transporter permease [Promicromonospora citrea]|uniref:Sugar ABC transporter permease n=1 Tax=Promicromonospora citrea TaxID=43677 RepID=A0A8H9GJE2_9MICO|nr:sugar ABC transporter permease [Promicromonospora citrea]NNH52658.1 sugar ABC transporter permease [Promicromonospora citrea]GGM32007.1 sugar ABC transporter permease [Promicromonospora citrea]
MLKKLRRVGPPLLLLAPSLILVGVFVYGLIAANFSTSLTDNHTAAQATGQKPAAFVWFTNYLDLLASEDFQHSLTNLVLYTVVFLAGTMVMGFLWAWMLEKPVKGEGLFRSVYLFPMAVSFVASGVVWRWLLNSNQDEQASGLNRLFQVVGLDVLQNNWWNNVTFGIVAIAIPAIWQLSGYVMALFLAGFRGIPDELREAARVDGASEWKLYRHVLFPQLSPVALSALIIIGHMSLKAFDLIMSISKPANYQTKVPAVDMFVFKSSFDYANAAAVGSILLIIVALVIVPYLVRTNREEKR